MQSTTNIRKYLIYLNSVIIGIGYNNSICVRNSNVMWMLKFSFQRTKLAEFTHKGAVGLKYLQKEEEA